MQITKDQFLSYENVRQSGVTNMWAVDLVMKLSGLTQEQCLYIMKHYSELKEQYLKPKPAITGTEDQDSQCPECGGNTITKIEQRDNGYSEEVTYCLGCGNTWTA